MGWIIEMQHARICSLYKQYSRIPKVVLEAAKAKKKAYDDPRRLANE
jgi:hypothetical protein